VGLQAQLWRGIAAFRFASLGYAAVLLVVDRADYQRPVLAWAVLAGMTGWTVATSYAGAACDAERGKAAGGGRAGHPGTGEVDHAAIVGRRAGPPPEPGYSTPAGPGTQPA
jgi:Family of unknown function (DUF5931)